MSFKFERLQVWQKAISFANTMFDEAYQQHRSGANEPAATLTGLIRAQ